MARRYRTVSDKDRIAVWNAWLNGDSVAAMLRYDAHELSRGQIKNILAGPAPDEILGDPRLDGRRYFFVVAEDIPVIGIFRHPRKFTLKAFRRALKLAEEALRHDYPGFKWSELPAERFGTNEADVAERMIHRRGMPGWSFDESGEITPISRNDEKTKNVSN